MKADWRGSQSYQGASSYWDVRPNYRWPDHPPMAPQAAFAGRTVTSVRRDEAFVGALTAEIRQELVLFHLILAAYWDQLEFAPTRSA